MDDKKSVKDNSDELLDMISRYKNDNGVNKASSSANYNQINTAAPQQNAPSAMGTAPIQERTIQFNPQPQAPTANGVQPMANQYKVPPVHDPQPKVPPMYDTQPVVPPLTVTQPVITPVASQPGLEHYSDFAGLDGVVRPAPKNGHLTDDDGNLVEVNDKEDALADLHFSGNQQAKAKARKAYSRAKRRNAKKKHRGSVAISVVKALVYTFIVCILSFFAVFGCFDFWPGIIPMANDIFSFSKGGGDVVIELGEGMTTAEVAAKLEEKGIIDEQKVFKFYVKYKFDKSVELKEDDLVGSMFDLGSEFVKTMFFGGDIDPQYDIDYISGTHTLSADMNYDQIIQALTTTAYVREEVTVTVPEGYTVEQIISLLVSNGIGTRDGYIHAINQYPYKHEFVQLLNEQGWEEGRLYRLEGYLYPDTYLFYKDTNEVEVINKMLNGFSSRVWNEYYTTYKPACEKLGFTFDEMIRFASIVQAEGKSFTDFENVSQVFHNRFTSSSFDKMESCATIQYVMDYDNIKNGLPVNRKPVLSDEDTRYETPYNTYLYQGLPPGAICNPGLDAIEAALYPDMSDEIKKKFGITTAYYFNSDMAGNIYYAQTPYQHSINKQTADAVNKQIENGTYTGD